MIGTSPIEGSPRCKYVSFWQSMPLDVKAYTLRLTELVGFPKDNPVDQLRIAGPWVFEIANP